MLYQYLLDEVGRQRVKVVRRADRNDDPAIPLQGSGQGHHRGHVGDSPSAGSGLGLGLGAGEPVVEQQHQRQNESTGLPPSAAEGSLALSRSRSERRPASGVRPHHRRRKTKKLRQLFLGLDARNRADEFGDDGSSVPPTPLLPEVFAQAQAQARDSEVAEGDENGGGDGLVMRGRVEKRLTM